MSAPLPHFVETFMDDGYMDMYKVMRGLREVNFNVVMIPDHIPEMIGGSRAGTAFSIAYMKALLRAAVGDRQEAAGARERAIQNPKSKIQNCPSPQSPAGGSSSNSCGLLGIQESADPTMHRVKRITKGANSGGWRRRVSQGGGAATKLVGASGAGPGPNAVRPYIS